MADAGEIKNMNTNAIRHVLKQKGPISKNRLARETGLSFPTISRAVDTLVAAGELLDKGAEKSTGGRCAQLYAINPTFKVTLSMRLEAQELGWFISDLTGNQLEAGTEICEGILQTIDTLIMRVQERYSQLGAISMGVAGTVHEGVVTEAFGYDELRGVNLSAYLNHRFGLPAVVEGDMQIVSTGYWSFCPASIRAVVCIYLGKIGIGGGIVIDGKAWNGASSFAGELHYLPIENNLKYAKTNFEHADIVEYYGKIIRSYVSILNPDRIVLYENRLISGQDEAIRRECEKYLPPQAVPIIKISAAFDEHYERGLFVLAENLLAETVY
ncbi:ROK family protein [Paenibacillus sp. GCM10027626]|uniref:ROK family protein n=1 Tax=Paenibacillus sp. GCM10027626 TaxID=3273411 RepID=UPI0036449BAE